MLSNYRQKDAVIIICQDNARQIVEIAGVNDRARSITGFADEEIIGRPLENFVSPKIAAMLVEYVEYDEDARDVGEVLNRIYEFQLKKKDGEFASFRMRVVRCEVLERKPTFHLVLQDTLQVQEENNFKRMLSENFKGHEVIDDTTGLPTLESLIKDLELVCYHSSTNQFQACLAVFEIDNVQTIQTRYGSETVHFLLRHIGETCRQRLRTEDTIGMGGENELALILMQITPESARVVLNRLRWAIASAPVNLPGDVKLPLSVSVSFQMIGDTKPEDMLENARRNLANIREKGGNSIDMAPPPR